MRTCRESCQVVTTKRGIFAMDFFNIELPEELSAGLGAKYKYQEEIHSPGPTRPDGLDFFV